ncbi:hypothetical protein NUM3379_27250 [Kineococcus sp. NUM-3379]
MSAAGLSWRLLRAGGRRGLATAALAGAGFAATTLLLLLCAGTLVGLDARADRTQWRTPLAADSPAGAPAVQRTTTSAHDGRQVVVVDLAATGAGTPPAVPGLAAFPAPGQAYLSPALAELVRERPAELGTRFGPVAGELGGDALAFPEELVAVVGRAPGDAAVTAPAWRDQRSAGTWTGPVPVEDLTGTRLPDGPAAQYLSLAVVAVTLLVVPLLVLAGAAARLGLARRDQRLAALRLAGASPRQVVTMTAVESALPAAAGALVGVVGALLLVPVVAQVPVAGGRWYAADLVPPPLLLAAVVVGVVALAVGSAVSALRRVLASPLGVAAGHAPRRPGLVRVLVPVALLVGFLRYSESGNPSTTALVGLFAAVFAALAVVGPWVVGVLGRVVVHRASGAPALLAGRRMLDDPRGTWRVVGSVAMTGFVAGTLALFPTGSGELVWGGADRLDVALPAATAGATADRLRTELAAAGVDADVQGPGTDRGALLFLDTRAGPAGFVAVTVAGPERDLEVARTVVGRVAPASVAATGRDVVIGEVRFATDFRAASVLVLAVSFLVAMASAGITSAASVLDRRRTYRQLALVGVPLRVLDRARLLETQLPLVLLAVGSTVTGVVAAAPLTRLGLGGGGVDVSGFLLLVGCTALGLLGVRVASAASRPLLARVSADPASTAD